MDQDILHDLLIIPEDFFTAFGLYSLLWLLVCIFTRKPLLKQLDEQANKLISLIGVLYLIVWIPGIMTSFQNASAQESNLTFSRWLGQHWAGFWLQPILWIVMTQLLRIKKIRRNVLLRILFSLLFLISVERYIIIVTSLHRDYLPGSWTMHSSLGIYPSNFILGLLAKIVYFVIFTGLYTWAENISKKLINKAAGIKPSNP